MNRRRINRISADGYTLLEIVLVIAIIGILASIAFPAYRGYVQKSRRSDARQSLLNAVNRQEQYVLDNKSYASSLASLGISSDSTEGYYTISVATSGCGNTPCYIFTATAISPQDSDTECQTLTIRTDGTKGYTGTGSLSKCW